VTVFEVLSSRASVFPLPNGGPCGPRDAVGGISWAPGGGELAVVSGFASQVDICVWDVHSRKLTRIIPVSRDRPAPRCDQDLSIERESPQSLLAWAPDGQVLALFSGKGLSLWNANTGSLRRRLPTKEFVISMSW